MPVDRELASAVLAHVHRDELAELARALVDIPSPTGQERAVADYCLEWFGAQGLKAVRQEVEPDRPNAVGILRGQGGGLSLMFNGHLDTSYTGTEADRRMIATLEPDSELRGAIVGDEVRGLGASNMKGGVAAFMIAGKALKASGVPLRGDVIFAAVVGEISRTPVGPFQSQEYRGEGIGTRHLLTHGVQSDYAIVADGSDLNIIWAQTGVVQLKLTTYGQAEAAWGTDRAEFPPKRVNAVVKMAGVIEAIERWAERFEREHVYQAPTGPILPKVNVGGIEGGAPYRPNYFPGVCSLYLDVRTPPGLRPVQVQAELRGVLDALDIEYDLEAYRSLMGYEGRGVEPVVACLEEVHQHLFGEPLRPEAPRRASIWTDTNVYNELGVPAVKIGPRGRRTGPRAEAIKIDDLVKAAQIYALAALDICNRPR